MPDLFTCHIIDALELGEDNLVPWDEQFTPDELSDFIPGFLSDGTAEDGRLLIFPVSKSTQLLMCNGSGFDRFSAATGVGYEDLATWEGFYDAAGRFYDWSGKPFCALDYPIRAVELCAMERGSGDFYTENGWYDTDNAVFKESWMQFARSLAQGHVVVSDLYSNTQVMTGDVLSGLGSSAAILYPTTEAPAPILATETHHCLTACNAAANTIALHRADDGFGKIPHIEEEVDLALSIRPSLHNIGDVMLHAFLEIKSGSKCFLALCADHDHLDIGIVCRFVQVLTQPVDHGGVKRVALFRPVQRNDANAILFLVQNNAHNGSLLLFLRRHFPAPRSVCRAVR